MHVVDLSLENWSCFRGKHSLSFDPIPYAITASCEGDPERSNWSGKSTVLEAFLFVLTGQHRHRLEEGWVSRGEKQGSVQALLSDGTRVRRFRVPGAGTQLEVVSMDDIVLTGDVAQQNLNDRLGLGVEDFRTTSYFAQGETSGMVRSDPAQRTATVARWLRLEPLQACAASVQKKASAVEMKLAGVRGRISAEQSRIERALEARAGVDADRLVIEQLRADLASAEVDLREVHALESLVNEQAALATKAEERARVGSEGAALLKIHRAEDGEAIAREFESAKGADEAAKIALASLRETLRHRLSVVTGTFGGECPISGRDCPVKDEINREGERSRDDATVAQNDVDEQIAAVQGTSRAYREAQERAAARRTRRDKLETLQEQYRAMVPVAAVVDVGDPAEVRADRDTKFRRIEDLKRRIREHEQATAAIAKLEVEVRALEVEHAVCLEAAAIFGRSGAQRRLAEGVLGSIAGRANRMLASAGVELSMAVEWERDGKGLADDCSSCGAAFPSSAKVKKCASCGEARGGKRVQRLDVELSSRSGAAEDLAGLALSLSAGAWLRGDRGSPWSAVFLDEPWSQLDKAHRRIASQHVPALLAASHVRQAFVISHDPASVASLPGRIAVTSDGTWSRVSVA